MGTYLIVCFHDLNFQTIP